MKKVVGIILALSLLFSFVCFASAAGNPTVNENSLQTLTLKSDETAEYTFTPQSDGVYILCVNILSAEKDSIQGIISDVYAGEESIASGSPLVFSFGDLDSSLYSHAERLFPGEKGKPVTVYLNGHSASSSKTEFSFEIKKASVDTLTIDKEYTASGEEYCLFASPDKDEIYHITGNEELYRIKIISASGKAQILESIYNWENEFVFRLEKGEKYLIVLSSGSDKIKFTAKDGSKTTPEKFLVSNSAVIVGEEEEIILDCFPVGSEINTDKITARVDREKLASVYYSEEKGCFVIKGIRPGTVRLIITDGKTDVTTDAKIRVMSSVQASFYYSPYRIFSFVADILARFYDTLNKISGI